MQLLRHNVLANGLEGLVRIHPLALSDHDGSVALELSASSWGDHRVRVQRDDDDAGRPARLGETQRTTVQIPARRLDSLVEDGTIDLDALGLAIDVQGHEGHVFAGAVGLLSSAVPIVCEYWPYGLERAGGLERFHDLTAASRSRFIDLSVPQSAILPTAQLRRLLARYSGVTFTELLLLP